MKAEAEEGINYNMPLCFSPFCNMRLNCVLKDNVSSVIIQEYFRIIATSEFFLFTYRA